ncbi:hypothetical protein GJAV_G00149010 [Gymnothorax javanicus]|nr:hypothetical protein GJAV_G00149010 [Gymnothorax javanicus]
MNLYTTYIIMDQWALGNWACDLWLAIDYVASNASVMNLLVISFDRYFSVTRPLTYRAKRTTKRAVIMIVLAWFISFVLWAPAILLWQFFVGERTVPTGECRIQFLSEPIITFCTAIAAFYLPVTIMTMLYWRIYKETENRSKELAGLRVSGNQKESSTKQTGSSRSCSSYELNRPAQKSSTRRLGSRFCLWPLTKSAKANSEGETEHSSSDSWNNNEAGASESDEEEMPESRAIYSIVLNMPGLKRAINSQLTSTEDLDVSEEDPLKPDGSSRTLLRDKDNKECNSYHQHFSKMPVQSLPSIESPKPPDTLTLTPTPKSTSAPISFKDAAMAKRFATKAKIQITKRKKMSLVKEKKAAQTLTYIYFKACYMRNTMQAIQTREVQVPILKEHFVRTPFSERRRESKLSLCKQQQQQQDHQQQQQLAWEGGDCGQQCCTEHVPVGWSSSSLLCCASARADGGEREQAALASSASAPASPESQRGLARSISSSSSPGREASVDLRHGLITQGALLLKNMGNQDAKLKKAAGESGDGGEDAGGPREAESTKKGFHGKKSHGKHGKGGDTGKKKSKSESKSSVFSNIRIRKNLSKAKGLSTGSKEDILDTRASQNDELDSAHSLQTKTPDLSLSADELGHSDAEPERFPLTAESRQSTVETQEGQRASSGSDTDIYSFHSAAEQEDLLADIQQAIRLQQGVVISAAEELGWKSELKYTPAVELLPTPPAPEQPAAPEELADRENGVMVELSFSLDRPEGEDEEGDPGCATEDRSEGLREAEAALCAVTGTKELEPLSEIVQPPAAETEGRNGSAVTKTTSTNSFPDLTGSFESAEEPPEEGDGLHLPPSLTGSHGDVAQSRGDGSVNGGKEPSQSLESLGSGDLDSEEANGLARPRRRRSSVSFSQWPSESPLATRLLKSTLASNSSTPSVKPYPTIHPAYIKTTTRQLSSPSHSPAPSPSHSPLFHRRREEQDDTPTKRWVRRQRSNSIAGLLSHSVDWTEELNKLRPRKADSADYLEYSGSEERLRAGSLSLSATRKSSGVQASTWSFQDVFSGRTLLERFFRQQEDTQPEEAEKLCSRILAMGLLLPFSDCFREQYGGSASQISTKFDVRNPLLMSFLLGS